MMDWRPFPPGFNGALACGLEPEVWLYVADPAAFTDADATCLSREERARMTGFRFARDRNVYRAAHILLRRSLSRHLAIQPEAWRFKNNAYGKPYVANKNGKYLRFNLTHTENLSACVVSERHEVGVDAERIRPFQDLRVMRQAVLTAEELTNAISDDAQDQIRNFLTYWTLKESYIKTIGLGLSIPLQSFCMRRDRGGDWRVVDESRQGVKDSMKFKLMQLSVSHMLAVCVAMQSDMGPGAQNHLDI